MAEGLPPDLTLDLQRSGSLPASGEDTS